MSTAGHPDLLARLQEELSQKSQEVRVLREVSFRINATLNLEELFEIVLHTMHDLFEFRHSLILLLDESSGCLRVAAGRGYPEPPLGRRVEIGDGVIGTVARRKKMMRVGNLGRQRAYAEAVRRQVEAAGGDVGQASPPELPGLPDAQSQVAIPLLVGDRLVGVFVVESVDQGVFNEYDEMLVAIVANLSAGAIHNALLFRKEEKRRECLEVAVEARTRELHRTSQELDRIQELRAKESQRLGFEDIVGTSPAITNARRLLQKVARSPASTILITGENGTGKDLAARVVHNQSSRSDAPFMNITCSALTETLLESELFGHERGAFTDAHRQKKGLLELADTGSVFLDEIGEMSLALQAKLLRFLEQKTFRRVGGTQDIKVDVRIIAATNRDLAAMVAQGAFREDLYYRLLVLPVALPALRERTEDIPELARMFLQQFRREFKKDIRDIQPEVFEKLKAYPWPGNVRELRNAVERAVLLAEGPVLRRDNFQMLPSLNGGSGQTGRIALPAEGLHFEQLERTLVIEALEREGWNKSRAAHLLGMPREWLRYRIEKFGLAPPVHH